MEKIELPSGSNLQITRTLPGGKKEILVGQVIKETVRSFSIKLFTRKVLSPGKDIYDVFDASPAVKKLHWSDLTLECLQFLASTPNLSTEAIDDSGR